MLKYINRNKYDTCDMRYHLLEYSEIVKGLFVGSRKILDLYPDKVYMIVNCTKDIPFPDKPDIIEYIRIPMDQDPDTRSSDTTSEYILNYIHRIRLLERIHLCISEDGTVLVHCLSGIQRSCTIIVLYLLKYHNMTPQTAIEYIRKRRRVAFHGGEIHYMKAIDLFYNTL